MRTLLIIVLLLFTFNCKHQEIIGRYKSETSGVIEIKSNGKFSLYRTFGNGHVVIPGGESEGIWTMKTDDILVLNSNYQFNNYGEPLVEINVEQNRSQKDRISITFSNIESYMKIQEPLGLELLLELKINEKEISKFKVTDDFKQLKINKVVGEYDSVNFNLIFKKSCSECSMPDMNNFFISDFNSNLGQNDFRIELPEFIKSSFNYIYLKDEFMFLKTNKIHWNGEIYRRDNRSN